MASQNEDATLPPLISAATAAISAATSALDAFIQAVSNAESGGPPGGITSAGSDGQFVTTVPESANQVDIVSTTFYPYKSHGTIHIYQSGTPSYASLYQATTDLYNVSSNITNSILSNSTASDHPIHGPIAVTLISIMVTVLAVLTAGGNLLVMVSFKMDTQLQTVSNYFLLSLAVADFFIGLFSMPLYTVYLLLDRWPLGSIICDTWLSMDYTMSNASVANLLLISFDRYFSVKRPLTYRAKRTPQRAAIMISCAWVISAVLWTPWIFAWPYIEGHRTVPNDECYIQFLTTNQYITVITCFAAFYLPVLIMCILYFKIYMETEKRQKGLANLQATSGMSDRKRYGDSSDDDVCVSLSHKRCDSSPELEELNHLNDVLHRHRKKRTCWQMMRNCCKIDKEIADVNEDSSSEEPGSPTYSEGTPSSSRHHHHIIPLRRDQSAHAHQNGKHNQHRKNSASGLMIPLITVDSNRSTPTATPSTELTGTFSRHSNLSSSTAMTRFSEGDDRQKDNKKDMYTILIKLPDTTSDPHAKPSIRMITDSEDEGTETDALTEKSDPYCDRKRPSMDGKKQDSQESQGEIPVRRHSNTTDSLRMAVQARVAAKLATKVKSQRARKQRMERKQDKKAAKTLSAILLAFIITWTPYNIFTVIQTFCSDACINPTLYAIGKCGF